MKKLVMIVLALMLTLGVFACSAPAANNTPASNEPEGKKTVKIAYTSGKKGDNGYNDEAWQGLMEAKEMYDFEYVSAEVDNTDPVATEALIRGYAEDGVYDAIISVGTGIDTPTMAVAKDYPDQKFILIDSYCDAPNIMCIGAISAEQAFLSGVLSGIITAGGYTDVAKMSNDTPLISYCIGMDNPDQRAGASGYMAGVKYVNPDVEIRYTVIGGFADPVTAKEVTSNNIALGADICTGNCGAGALGILEACKENGAYFISTSPSTTDYDFSLCTSLKLTNVGVRLAVQAAVENKFEAGTHRNGIASGYCEIGLDGIALQYPQEILDCLEAVRQSIKDGKLVTPDDLTQIDSWVAANHLDATQFGVKMGK